MNYESIKNAPKDAATSNEAVSSSLVTIETNGLYNNSNSECNENIRIKRTENGLLLYEFRQGDEWKPSRKGCTIPMDEIEALCHALNGYSGGN